MPCQGKVLATLVGLLEGEFVRKYMNLEFCQIENFGTSIGPNWLNGKILFFDCGNSSVDRAMPCQGIGRGFESRFPLHFSNTYSQIFDRNSLTAGRMA